MKYLKIFTVLSLLVLGGWYLNSMQKIEHGFIPEYNDLSNGKLHNILKDSNDPNDLLLASMITLNSEIKIQILNKTLNIEPDNLLVNYIAATLCLREEGLVGCNTDLYIKKLSEVDKNNSESNALQAKFLLSQNEIDLALKELEKINVNSEFNRYFVDLYTSIETALINNKKLLINSKNSTIFVTAMGFAAAHADSFESFHMCKNKMETEIKNYRWINACYNFSKTFRNSKTMIDVSLGQALEELALKKKGSSSAELVAVAKRKKELSQSLRLHGRLSLSQGVLEKNHKELDQYFKEFKEYGEPIAIKLQLERNKDFVDKILATEG